MRRFAAISAGVVLMVFLAATSVFAASHPVVNSLTLNEKLKETMGCFPNPWTGDQICDYPTEAGKATIKGKISMDGIDTSKFDADTPFVIDAGGLHFEGVLRDDWQYTPGSTRFNVSYIQRDEDYANPIKYMTVAIKWNERQMIVKITALTPDYIDPIAADYYLWNTTAKIGDGVNAYFQFGDQVYAAFNVPYTGKVSTKIKMKTNKRTGTTNQNGTTTVSIKGKGIPTNEDFREVNL
jgi:hypothetical protein